MFLNFTNHPAAGWSAEQRRAALAYGVILDLPFPDVPPKCSTAEVAVLADAWAARILAMHPDCVLCQGEMTLTARVVQLLREHRSLLDEVALYLLQKETITGDELMVYVNADAKSIPDHTGDEPVDPA